MFEFSPPIEHVEPLLWHVALDVVVFSLAKLVSNLLRH